MSFLDLPVLHYLLFLQVSYKKIQTNQLQQSIQLGIQYSIGAMSRQDERDLLMQDFMTVETVAFPRSGSQVSTLLRLARSQPRKSVIFLIFLCTTHQSCIFRQYFLTLILHYSQTTPAHGFVDFTFRTVAPLAFRYFLKLFGVDRQDFMVRDILL